MTVPTPALVISATLSLSLVTVPTPALVSLRCHPWRIACAMLRCNEIVCCHLLPVAVTMVRGLRER